MKKTSLIVALLIHCTIISAYSQSFSTLPPSVVGRPAVAIHSTHGNSQQVYQYSDTTPAPQPATTFIYDLNTGNSAIQFNSPGVILIQPLHNNND